MRLVTERNFSILLLLAVLMILTVHHLVAGPKASPDLKSFDIWSNNLVESGFNYTAYFSSPGIGLPERLYTASITLIALLKMVVPESWKYGYYYLNLIWMALTVFFFYKTARLLSIRHGAIAVALPLFLLSSDFHFWPRYLLTDTFVAFLVIFNVYLALRIWSEDKTSALAKPALAFAHATLLFLLLFSRPAALPLVAAFLTFHGLAALQLQRVNPYLQAVTVAALIILGAILFGHVMHGHATGHIAGFRELDYLGRYAHAGVVIIHRPETYLAIGQSTWDYAWLFLVRSASFYSPYASGFSLAHQLFNFLLHGTVAAAILMGFFSRGTVSDSTRRGTLLILLLSVAALLFHSFTIIDYDWRYRFPVITPLLLVVALAADRLMTGITRSSPGSAPQNQ